MAQLIRSALVVLALFQTCFSNSRPHCESLSEQPICHSPGLALLQRQARVGSIDAAGEVAADAVHRTVGKARISANVVEAATIKVWLPSFIVMFSVVTLLGLIFATLSGHCWYKENRGPGCICSGCLAVIFILLAVALVIFKVYLMRLAGPEPAGPVTQAPIETTLIVDTTVPFDSPDINKPGPVQTAYMEGMQSALDKKSGVPGALKVVGVRASDATAMLLQEALPNVSFRQDLHDASQVENRVSLVFTLSEQDVGDVGLQPPLLPRPLAADLEQGVQDAAKRLTGDGVPQPLKEIASGSLSAAANSAMEVKTDVSFRCEAKHQLNVDIRAAARIMLSKHREEILPELPKFARHKLPGFALKLAPRCNEPSQAEPMQLCLGPDGMWVDFVTQHSVGVPANEDSVENFVCSAGCTLGSALSAETARVIAMVNSQLQGLELDEAMLSKIACAPTMSEGRTCNAPCA